jgi:hypothetical protein
MRGYSSLPDILWKPQIQNLIISDAHLNRLFKESTSSRSAKRANEGLIDIATLILALEILATGTAGWGDRFPAASKTAQGIRDEFVPNARPWLIECYLYPDGPMCSAQPRSRMLRTAMPWRNSNGQRVANSSCLMRSSR